jgi:ribosomal protein S18 acetylase RimI-like enzyme
LLSETARGWTVSDERRVAVRPLGGADRPRLEALIRSIDGFTPGEVACALELVDLAAAPGCSDYLVLVAEASPAGPLLGYACFGPTPLTRRSWDLYWIASAPSTRGCGVGRALHDAVVAAVRRAGGRLIRVETSAKDAYGGTRRFYERSGYREAGRIEHFYADEDHLVILVLEVDGGREAAT